MEGRNAKIIARYHPRYRSPKLAYQEVLREQVGPATVWLDIGCGKRVCGDDQLNAALPRQARLTIGCDRDPYLSKHSSIRDLVVCDAAALPFRDGTFNLVTASMVLEHLEAPETVFREVARISEPGGVFVVFTPNRFNYAMIVAALTPYRFHLMWKKLTYYLARREWVDHDEDLFPTFYRANSVTDLRRLLAGAQFEEERIERHAMAHSFGFLRPLYALSLLFERLIDRLGLHALKADLLGVFVRAGVKAESAPAPRLAGVAAGRR